MASVLRFLPGRRWLWPVIGLATVVLSVAVLRRELAGITLADVWQHIEGIPAGNFALIGLFTLIAYGALAWYDRIALLHLNIRLPLRFVALCSFTTYALAHNIGAALISGAVVRYRAYSTQGLRPGEVAVLIGVTSFTFIFGTVLLFGVLLAFWPGVVDGMRPLLPAALATPETARALGFVLLAGVAAYVLASLAGIRPRTIRGITFSYPRPAVTFRQVLAAPLELVGAAGIIYFALPEAGNPGFLVVLAIFLVAFTAVLVSHAPGGIGVFELVFITALPTMAQADVLGALIIFRLFYLLIPLVLSIPVIIAFERERFRAQRASGSR